MQRFIFISILLLLTACGGGGGGVSPPAPVNKPPAIDDDSGDNDKDDEEVDAALAHCATPTGGNTFTNVTTDLGLCYDARSVGYHQTYHLRFRTQISVEEHLQKPFTFPHPVDVYAFYHVQKA